MVRLVGQEVTGACKAKAQSGALLMVGGAVVPFCVYIGLAKKKENIESIERRLLRQIEKVE